MALGTGWLAALGGLGLFLVGMAVLTDGLKSLAGASLSRGLARATRSPTTGAVTGAVATFVVQSSSATTVAAVGFVGAGLLTFPQALGIVFGANVGTTLKGWVFALVGFQWDVAALAPLCLLAGGLLRLLGAGRSAAAGYAIAGFGLVFAGLAGLQAGMEGFAGSVTPDDFPPDTFVGRLLLVAIGGAITLVTQSSSAGIAIAITAVHAGTISLPQSLALAIGMDVATTVTALVAALGGTTQARRTGWAHVVYNLLTGVGAFLLISPFLWGLGQLAPRLATDDPELALVAFHSGFNLLGVLAVLPFARPFARLVERLVPEREPSPAARLEPGLLREPAVAVEAAAGVLRELVEAAWRTTARMLRRPASEARLAERLDGLPEATEATRRFLAEVRTDGGRRPLHAQHVALLSVADHLERFLHRTRSRLRLVEDRGERTLRERSVLLGTAFARGARALRDPAHPLDPAPLESASRELAELEQGYREGVLRRAAAGELDDAEALARLDEVRRLKRLAYHAWRMAFHLAEKDRV